MGDKLVGLPEGSYNVPWGKGRYVQNMHMKTKREKKASSWYKCRVHTQTI